jgi:hypothetical protein
VILDDRPSLEHPLGEAIDVLLTHDDAERFWMKCAATIPASPRTRGSRSSELGPSNDNP